MGMRFSRHAKPVELEEPIRAELFGVERLEQHAASLAVAQVVTDDARVGRLLTPRVLDNGRVLVKSYQAIARTIHEEKTITPAAEWFVDNMKIIDGPVGCRRNRFFFVNGAGDGLIRLD